jgi:hypothetical protein
MMARKKKATDGNVTPKPGNQYQPPPEVLNDPDLPEQFKNIRLYDEEPEPEEESESTTGVHETEVPEEEGKGTSDQDETGGDEEESEETGADEEEIETGETGEEPEEPEETEEKQEQEETKPEPFISLKHRGKIIDVPNTPEGIEKARMLMQQGFEFAQNMTKIKPYLNVIKFLNENSKVYDNLVKVMNGEAEKLVSEPEPEQEDYVPPEMNDDETTEEYNERVRADMKEFYRQRSEEKAREEAHRQAMVQQVINETRQDRMFQPTMIRFNNERQNNIIPEPVVRLIDKNPDAFRYFYNAQRTLAQYDILFNALRQSGILNEETIRRIASNQQPNPQTQQRPPAQQQTAPKAPPKPEGQKPPKTETKSRRGPLHKGKTTNPNEIDWESTDQIKALDLNEIKRLADNLP